MFGQDGDPWGKAALADVLLGGSSGAAGDPLALSEAADSTTAWLATEDGGMQQALLGGVFDLPSGVASAGSEAAAGLSDLLGPLSSVPICAMLSLAMKARDLKAVQRRLGSGEYPENVRQMLGLADFVEEVLRSEADLLKSIELYGIDFEAVARPSEVASSEQTACCTTF